MMMMTKKNGSNIAVFVVVLRPDDDKKNAWLCKYPFVYSDHITNTSNGYVCNISSFVFISFFCLKLQHSKKSRRIKCLNTLKNQDVLNVLTL